MARRRKPTIANTVHIPSVFSAAQHSTRRGLLGATALAALIGWGVFAFTTPAGAQLPTGGTVVGGSATITTGTHQVTVNQSTNRGMIDWRSFSIGQGSRVDFRQPGASSVTLNRVTGPDPSVIAGQLTANGQIVLVNGAGVLFANGAQVNVGSLVASTANIANTQDFMAGGKLTFGVPSPNANAGVVNEGTITVKDGGLVGLVGNMAANTGVINARLGRVTIGGAETFTVDLAGDGLINFQIGQPVSRQPTDAKGNKMPLASNTGSINADGGVVTMTARAAGSVVDSVVNVGGAIRAQAVTQENGVLVLGGVTADAGVGGTVNVTGNVDVSGKSLGQRGGQVVAATRGGKVDVAATAVIDASGASGGGQVNIGGSYQGKGPIANARDTSVETGAKITADATARGNGGTVIVWADNATVFGGTISAKGGLQGGDGGFAEVSGKNYLDYRGITKLGAPLGQVGTLLLDPSDITIQEAGGDDTTSTPNSPVPGTTTIQGNSTASILTVEVLESTLVDANVTVNAFLGSGTGVGTITVKNAISIPDGRTLSLTAPGAITVNAPITTIGNANLSLQSTSGAVVSSAAGPISLGNGLLTVLGAAGGLNLSVAAVTVGTLSLNVSGSVAVTNAGNSIGLVRGTADGPVNITTAGPLTIDVPGLATSNADISLQSGGGLALNGPVNAGSGTLSLQGGGLDGQGGAGGAVTAGTVNFTTDAALHLTHPDNAIGTVATTPSSAVGVVSIFSSTSMTIAAGGITASSVHLRSAAHLTVNGNISTPREPSNPVRLESTAIGDAGSIRQTAGTISAGQIFLDADTGTDVIQTGGNMVNTDPAGFLSVSARTVQLTSPTNDLVTIFGFSSTDFRYVDANTVTLGSGVCPEICGIIMGAGRYLDISANGISILPGAEIGTTSGPVDNPAGVVVLRPTTPGTPMVIGGTGGTGLAEAALATGIRAGTLRIGSIGRSAGLQLGGATAAVESPAGALTVQGLTFGAGAAVGTLVLESAASGVAISQTGPIGVNALATAVTGSGSVALTAANQVGTIAHVARLSDTSLGQQTGAFQYVDATGVTIATVGNAAPPLVGQRDSGSAPGAPANAAILTSNGAVSVSAANGITVGNAIDTGNADLALSAGTGSITSDTAAGTISAGTGVLTLQGGGDGNELGGVVRAGVLNFTFTGPASIINPDNVIGTVATVPSSAITPSQVGGSVVITSATPLTIASGGISASEAIGLRSLSQVTVNGDLTAPSVALATVDGSGGVVLAGGTIAGDRVLLLTVGSGSILQTGGRILSPAGTLEARAGQSVQLTSAENNVAVVFGSAGTDFRYVDADALQLGGACGNDVCGITIGAGGYLDVAANGFSILSGVPIGAAPSPGPPVIDGPANNAPVDNPTGVTVLRPATAGTAMTLGGAGTGLTEAAVANGIRTGTLRIGSIGRAAGTALGGATTAAESAAGGITVQGLDLTAGAVVQTLVLESGASGTAISQTAAVRVNHLATAVVGTGSVELTDPNNSVAGLAHVARVSDATLGTQSGTYRYVDGSSIPVVTVAGSGTPLIGQRDSGEMPGAPARSAILTAGGDITLVSRTGNIDFINGLAAIGATARLSAAADISQSTVGGVVTNGLLAVAGGAVDLSTAAGLNNVRFLSGSATGASETLGDFRLTNAASVTVPTGGVIGDSLVPTVAGVHAGFGATLELAIRTGDIVVNDTALTTMDGLVLLRRVAGATGSEIILNDVSFDTGSGSPNLVVLDLTGSPAMSPSNFSALKSSTTPPSGTSAMAIGPNPDGGILLTNVNAGNTTVYLLGGTGSSIAGSGTYGVLGVYVAHGNPVALTGSVRQIDPTTSHAVTVPFSAPFDSTTFAGFYVRRQGAVVDVQTFNGCPIGSGICPTPPPPPPREEPGIPPTVQWPPDDSGRQVGVPERLVIDFVPDRAVPTPLGLSTVILVNQGNEYFFNVDDDQRKVRAARGGK